MDLKNVYLDDSWVLGIETDDMSVCFLLDAVLEPAHPKFYAPPKPNEQYAYARLRWCLEGEVLWTEGPKLDDPATDASGEVDFGNIDSWSVEGDTHHIHGSWGNVTVRRATQTVDYLDI